MSQIVISNTLEFVCPTSFRKLDSDEIKQMHFVNEKPDIVLENRDAHMLICISHRHFNPLLGMMVSEDSAIKTMEKHIATSLAHLQFQLIDFHKRNIGNQEASSFSYTYFTEDTPMYGESMICKDQNDYYYIHYYCRDELKEENEILFESFLSSAQWRNK